MKLKIIFLIFLYCVNISLCAENESTEEDKKSDEPTDGYEDAFDHSAFLKIDDSEDIQIQNSKESKLKMRKLIRKIDVDKDKKLSEKELTDWITEIIQEYVLTEGKKYMPKIDSDDDGHATWDEYTVAAGYTKGDQPEPRKHSAKTKGRDKEKFDIADSDHDGKLSYYELGIFLHPIESQNMGHVVTSEFLESLDTDEDGFLSAVEFSGGEHAEIDESYKTIDKDNNGLLDRTELRDWMTPPNKNPFVLEAQMLRGDLDQNKDGFITEKEIFKHYARFATSRATLYGKLLRPDSKNDRKKAEDKAKMEGNEDKPGQKKATDEL